MVIQAPPAQSPGAASAASATISDAIAPPPPRQRSSSQAAAAPAEPVDDGPVLTVPYPVEDCCSQLLRQMPGRLGLFIAGRPGNYAFRCNQMSIEQTVRHLGYKITSNTGSADDTHLDSSCPTDEAADQEDAAEEAASATEKAAEKAASTIEEAAEKAASAIEEAAEKAASAIEEAAEEAASATEEAAEKATSASEKAAEKATSASEKAAEKATSASEKAAEKAAAAQRLVDALDAESSRLSFVFLKPCLLPWDRMANCVTFEPYHRPSLFAADKWNMAQIMRRRSRLPSMRLVDANGDVFDDSRFTMYTANAGRGQKLLVSYLDANPGVYVLKKTNSSMGIGIHMYEAQQPNTIAKLQRCAGGPRARLSNFVLQKYIERPLLVDKRKFDLRCYLLVLSCSCPQRPGERGYFAFCHPGYLKLSSTAYVQDSRDPRVHFTNQWVQRRRRAQYERVKEATTWLPDELDDYLGRRGRTEAGWCRRRMYRQVQAICGYLAAACRPYLESRRPGCVFRVYGPDLIVDEELRLQLLEFNCFPCYAKNTMALSVSVGGMWSEAVAVATEAALRFRERRPIGCSLSQQRQLQRCRLATEANFRLVHSSERPEVLADLVRSCYP